MILVDTSVWSLALRRKRSAKLSAEESRLAALLAQGISDGRVALIGPIRQELLSGVKEPAQFEKLRTALEPFRDEILITGDYEEAARLYSLCRGRGVECGPVDILICAVAARRQWKVLTHDRSMKECLEVIDSVPKTRSKSRSGTGT